MLFRLKDDYPTNEDLLSQRYGIKTIKKGAPLMLKSIDGVGNPTFGVYIGDQRTPDLLRLNPDGVVLLEKCAKEGRKVFCADRKEFFGISGLDEEIRFCPGCGNELSIVSQYPCQEIDSDPTRFLLF